MTADLRDGFAEAARAEELRSVLVDRLCGDGVVRSAAVEAVLRRVPRHLFVPGTSVEEAYADEAVYTKRDPETGASVSAASQPRIVAMMLEQLQAAPGMRVLELGAGTGYNAALLAALVGPEGRVATVDVDGDLVTGARDHLAAAGAPDVEAVLGDGALGHPDSAPYDRIIATVGAYEVPTAPSGKRRSLPDSIRASCDSHTIRALVNSEPPYTGPLGKASVIHALSRLQSR